MGGCVAKPSQRAVTETRRALQPKTPVLLFYLPGPVREFVQRLVQVDPAVPGASGIVNVRYIDAQNQRQARRYWLKELSGRRDYAAALYLADLRDHPTLLLTARTLNWFLRTIYKTYEVRIIGVYDNQTQLDEFIGYLPPGTEVQPLCEKDNDSVQKFIDLMRSIEQKFIDSRRTQTTTATLR